MLFMFEDTEMLRV